MITEADLDGDGQINYEGKENQNKLTKFTVLSKRSFFVIRKLFE